MRTLSVLAIVAVALAGCGGDDDDVNSESANTTTTATTIPAPSCDTDPIGCHMTRDSGVFGVPYPDDSVTVDDDFVVSSITNVRDMGAWYNTHLVAAGWTFDAESSVLDPSDAEGRKLGYISNGFYCKANPEQWVDIIIGRDGDGPAIKITALALDEIGCLGL